MESAEKSKKGGLLRFAREFAIIVLGVLTALGAESWVRYSIDRSVEKSYLERLLDDVRYDIGEPELVLSQHARSDSAATWLFQLRVDEQLEATNPEMLAAPVFVASGGRVPDLSRGTWEEALSSGRIALIQNPDILSALASYDRAIRESKDAWQNNLELPLWRASTRAIASAAQTMIMSGCTAAPIADRCTVDLLPLEAQRLMDVVSSESFIGDLNQDRTFRLLAGSLIRQPVLPEARKLETALMKELNISE